MVIYIYIPIYLCFKTVTNIDIIVTMQPLNRKVLEFQPLKQRQTLVIRKHGTKMSILSVKTVYKAGQARNEKQWPRE